MSTQLTGWGIEFVQGYGAAQLDLRPDMVVVGNALSSRQARGRGHARPRFGVYVGPVVVGGQVLKDRHVLAVAGTHGKTTTSSMLAWILEHAGLNPGFLIGGVPSNFDSTARLGPRRTS